MIRTAAVNGTTRFHRVLDAALGLVTRTETTLAEFVSSTTLLYLGFLLALPGDLLINAPLYNAMMSLMPEAAWGAILMALGAFQSYANLRRDARLRRVACALAASVFSFIGFLGVRVYPISPFGALCKVHALGQVIAWLHLGHSIRSRSQGEG